MHDRFTLDAYVVDSLMPDLVGHDRRASAFVVFMYLWRRTRGGTKSCVVSHRMIADATGLSKRGAQHGLARLEERRLVELRRKSPTSAPAVALQCEWRRGTR